MIDLTTIPYIEAANWSRQVGPQDKGLIVVHCMQAAELMKTAENVAAWFAGKSRNKEGKFVPAPKASAHYCVDADSVVCCVPSDRIAWHAPGANKEGIGIELAGYARQSRRDWLDDYGMLMLVRAGSLIAALSQKHDIPLLSLGEQGVAAGLHGIATHAIISKVFQKSTHTDPGPSFPMDRLLEYAVDLSP